MNIWEPKSCCCGASVRVGSLVLGWLRLIGSVFSLLSWMKFVMISYDDFSQICKQVSEEVNQPIDPDVCATAAISIISVGGVCSGLIIIITSLLLSGINKNKPKMMLPFLVTSFIEIVLFGLIILVAFVIFLHIGAVLPAFIFIVMTGLVLTLEVYFFLVIRACYKEVKQHSERMGSVSDIPYTEKQDFLYKI